MTHNDPSRYVWLLFFYTCCLAVLLMAGALFVVEEGWQVVSGFIRSRWPQRSK